MSDERPGNRPRQSQQQQRNQPQASLPTKRGAVERDANTATGVPPTASLEVASTYLLDFFAMGGRSVLVRGDPGTGKTSLVLQLLDYHSKNGFKSVYMSTRLSAKTLKSHQPSFDVVQGKYGTVPRLEEQQIGFQDSRRMDGVRAISGLRQYLEQVANPFVVLDSWEGLFFESHAVGVEEISKLVEDYEARFVVVTERREQTDLDYLLDGVVVLRRKYHEGRIVREIELKKLRGVSIMQSRFLFTLDSGKFRYLAPFASPSVKETAGRVGEALESRTPGFYSSGSSELDSLLGGGFKRGSFNLLEIDNDVPAEARLLLIRTVFSNFVNTGHGIVYVPYVGITREELSESLPNLSDQTIERSIAFLSYEADESKRTVSSLKGELQYDGNLIDSKTIDFLERSQGRLVLIVEGQDALEGLYGIDQISRDLARSIALLKSLGNIRIQIASPNSRLLAELKSFCDTNLKMEMIHGTPVLYLTKPLSVLHGVIRDPAASGKLGLVPIV